MRLLTVASALSCCLLALMALAGQTGAQIDGKCPAGWINRQNSNFCYQMSDSEANYRTWADAKKACELQHASLLSVTDEDERNYVAGIINSYGSSGDKKYWWFGLTRSSMESLWQWDDGHTGNEQPGKIYQKNLLKYPITGGVSNSTPGNCMSIWEFRGSSFLLVWPKDCSLKYKYVCKKLKQEVTTCDTDNGWMYQNNRCYKVHNFKTGEEGQNWETARTTCNADESDLAVIPDADTNTAVHDVISKSEGISANFWIGLRTYADSDDPNGYAWRWVDDSSLTYETWSTGSRPSITPDIIDKTCVQTVRTDVTRTTWRAQTCTEGRSGFVCERSVGSCPRGWYQHRDMCYDLYIKKVSWDEASQYCKARNSSILQIKQKHIQDFINKYKIDFQNQGVEFLWIGMTRATNKDKLAWTTGGEYTKYFQNWADGQPDLRPDRANAIRIVASSEAGQWQAADPVEMGGFVCEIPLGKVPEVPTPEPPRFSCDDGWMLHGPSCYKLEIKYADWLTARGNCRNDHSADLIDIRSRGEQEFIQGQLQDHDFWIGLHTRTSEDRRWMWTVDETPMDYNNWNEGEPNNLEGEENCAEMYLSGKWNDIRCVYRLPYICKKKAYIGGTLPTLPPTTSLNWDPFCGPFWTRDLLSNYCYLFNPEPMVWVDAKHQCEYQGGKLLSIVSPTEKSYIASRMQEVVAANPDIVSFWSGFNDRAMEGRWVWDDGEPAIFLNWAVGEPNTPEENCVSIYPDSAYWNDAFCEKRFASICKKYGNAPTTTSRPATTISVPNGQYRGCRSGYTGFENMCYKVFGAENDEVMQEVAQQTCRVQGGNLASVNSPAEHTFLLELARKQGDFSFWIGLYDTVAMQRTMFFQWTDGSSPRFTSWYINEPNNHRSGEDCVESVNRDGWNGDWNDLGCTALNRFICKQRQIAVQVTEPITRPYGCDNYDDVHDGYCLKFETGTAALTAAEAQSRCADLGGTLATIVSKAVQDHFFMRISQTGARTDFWIGLTRSGNTFRWDDGRRVWFTYWKPGVPLQGYRASMSAESGQWQMSQSQETRYTNFICQARQPGRTTLAPTYNPGYCAPGWVEADNTCYKAFSASSSTGRLSWSEARAQCKLLAGDLASINSEEANAKLRETVRGFYAFWIGLNRRDSNQGFVWADGKAVSYFNWRGGEEPENIGNNQNCAVINPNDLKWTLQGCSVATNWLCETPKGIYPNGTTPEPTTPPDAPDCGDGWKYFNESCYLISSQLLTWHQSLKTCREHGGDLVSIHSFEENDFLTGLISKLHITSAAYWIGLNELGQNEGYRWSDGSGVNLLHWNDGEPNNWGGAEHCGSIISNSGLWNDDQCGIVLRYICKRSNDTSRTLPPATPMPGRCPKGFYTVGNKCFRFNEDDASTWAEAREKCEKVDTGTRSYLASISSEYEQAALAAMKTKTDQALWIGLYTRSFQNLYLWHDNSEVSYTNWDHAEPSSVWEQCVEMYTEKYRAGKWNDQRCTKKTGYVCMTYKHPELVTDWVPPTMVACRPGWHAYEQACFQFVTTPATWTGAVATCSSMGGQLASIHDLWEQNFVHFKTESIGRESTWIGLADELGSGQFAWSDKWPLTFANWGRGQPDGGGKKSCVFMDYTGSWFAGDCDDRLNFVCRQSLGPVPTTVPQLPGVCPDEFSPFGSSCYYVGNSTESKQASEAMYECSKRYRSSLVSILSQGEQDFVARLVRSKAQDESTRRDYWIGLLRGRDSSFEWTDNSPVGYTYWNGGEPSNTPNENCVEMYHLNLKWNDHYCNKRNSYICKMPKLPATVGSTTTPPHGISTTTTRAPPHTAQPTRSTTSTRTTAPASTTKPGVESGRIIADLRNDVLVAIAVLAFLLLLAGVVAAVIIYRRRTGPKSVDGAESGFTNANWSKSTDAVNLESSSAPRVQIQLDTGLENPSFST
uniref:C-type lectin domain-containing protein n=1 Tax=Macrostomum lignano TaxID=282301 RepID=A0A1I8HVV4_9PLAT